MSVTTRIADDADLSVLRDLDEHLSPGDLVGLVSAGRVMVAEVDGVVVGCLRWGMFWDEVPFMNLLWLLPEWRGQGIGTSLVEAWETAQVGSGHTMVLTSTVSGGMSVQAAVRTCHATVAAGDRGGGGHLPPRRPDRLGCQCSLASPGAPP